MGTRAYKDRVALSKARIDLGVRRLARENPDATPEEFKQIAREKLNVALTDEYAYQVVASTPLAPIP